MELIEDAITYVGFADLEVGQGTGMTPLLLQLLKFTQVADSEKLDGR